ncbi:MAG: type II toxin-antitoxin system HicB family antitoxin [Solidesulfovibrio sp. DCME]|uniref:type II toxin-antitoxin system HicB family antitoxin n=1 Tax=Solidesulfovibrio sp. DCME TaxID=3447380 RepID=UPI003D1171A3
MNAMTYKGYTGTFEFIPDDNEFHGRVMGIRDVIHFSGSSVDELRQALADSVDDYLEMCEQAGKTPEKPYSGQFRLRLTPEIHRLLAVAAKAKGKSLNEFVAEAAEKAAREAVL